MQVSSETKSPTALQISLDPNAVLACLESIRAARPLSESHPLWSLVLLQDRLRALGDIAGPHTRLEVVAELLRECLLKFLGPERAASPSPLQDLQVDYQTDNTYRQGYSLLYYRYLRPDLDLGMEGIAEWVGFVPRTLQRRQTEGAEWLTQDLLRREMAFRRHYQERKLHAQLPIPHERPYFTSSDWLDRAQAALAAGLPLLLVGPPNSGKTHAASHCLAPLLSQLDDLLVLHLIPGQRLLGQMEAALQMQAFGPAAGLASHQQTQLYFQHHRVGLLLENFHPNHLEEWSGLGLKFAAVVATATQTLKNWPGPQFMLEALDLEQANHFFQLIRGDLPQALLDEALSMGGGWPGHLLEYLHLRRFFPPEQSFHHSRLSDYYRGVWEATSTHGRGLWLLMATLGPGRTLPARPDDSEALAWLIQKGVVASAPSLEGYQFLAVALRACPNMESERALIQHFLANELANWAHNSAWMQIYLEVLSRAWFAVLPPEAQGDLLLNLSAQLDFESPWELWADFLAVIKPHLAISPYWLLWMALEHHRLQRQRGLLTHAGQGLMAVMQSAGGSGFFDLQAFAALEGAQVAVYQEDWAAAFELGQIAERYYERQTWGGKNALRARKLRLQALAYLTPPALLNEYSDWLQTQGWWELLSLGHQQNGQTDLALSYARRHLEQLSPESLVYGRALSRYAYLLWESEDWQAALDTQTSAVNYLSLSRDLIGLARAKNNLGVIYYHLRQPEQAQAHWEAALGLLLPLQDSLALRAIRANLALLAGSDGRPRLW